MRYNSHSVLEKVIYTFKVNTINVRLFGLIVDIPIWFKDLDLLQSKKKSRLIIVTEENCAGDSTLIE